MCYSLSLPLPSSVPALKVYTKQSSREHNAADAWWRTQAHANLAWKHILPTKAPTQRKVHFQLKQNSLWYFTLTSGNYRAEFHRLHHKSELNPPLSALISRHLENSRDPQISKTGMDRVAASQPASPHGSVLLCSNRCPGVHTAMINTGTHLSLRETTCCGNKVPEAGKSVTMARRPICSQYKTPYLPFFPCCWAVDNPVSESPESPGVAFFPF